MSVLELIFICLGAIICLMLGLFAVTSIRESRARAAAVGIIGLIVFAVIWFGSLILIPLAGNILLFPVVAIVFFVGLFFVPMGRTSSIQIENSLERVDERDVMFAREEYHPGTEKHETYYAMRPENKEIDDNIRDLPELLMPGGRYYDPIRSPYTQSIFKIIRHLIDKVDGETASVAVKSNPHDMTARIKRLARHLGADEVGIARLNSRYVYSYVGRGPEPWGSPIVNTHTFAVMFTLEMDYDCVERAPALPITEESARQYLRGTMISLTLADYIRSLGYPARAHISGSNYQIMLPPVAHDAGLGELGRHGYLISKKFGARVRLGGVTTDLPLIPDRPIVFGVQDFCDICLRCALNCPSASIPRGGKTTVRGIGKWQLNIESCLSYWRLTGTDCGLCMKVCPYSHPDTLIHNLVRTGIKRSSFARRISVYGENLFYGKRAAF